MNFSRLLIIPIISITALLIGSLALPATLFWYEILPMIGFVFLATSWLIPLFWYKRVPQVARLLVEAARTKKPILIIAHDTGRAALTLIQEYLGEGIVKTLEGLWKILPQFAPLTKEENPGTEMFEKTYRDFISKRSIMTGIDVPIFFAYSGKVCALNPEALALYEAGQMQIKAADGKYVSIEKGEDGRWKAVRGKIREKLLQPLMLLDPKRINDLIARQFDVTQFAAAMTESEQIGRYGRPSLSKFIIPIGILGLVIVVGIILLVMGPGLLEGFGGGI